VVDVEEVAEGVEHGEALGQKQPHADEDLLPEARGADEQGGAGHEVEEDRQHRRREAQCVDFSLQRGGHDSP
jgi:hypothetical protein